MNRHSSGRVINCKFSKETYYGLVVPPLLPPQMGGDPCRQFVQVNGLHDIIIGPSLKAVDLVSGFNTGRQEQNWTGDVFPYGLADSQAVHSWHIDVQ